MSHNCVCSGWSGEGEGLRCPTTVCVQGGVVKVRGYSVPHNCVCSGWSGEGEGLRCPTTVCVQGGVVKVRGYSVPQLCVFRVEW